MKISVSLYQKGWHFSCHLITGRNDKDFLPEKVLPLYCFNMKVYTIKPQLHIPDSGYDSSRFVPMRHILTNRDASGWLKQKIQKSLRCFTTFLRYLYDSSTIHDGATTMLLRQSHDITVGQSYCILGESG